MLPEYVLQKAIVTGIHTIRKDPKILNLLFGRLSRTQVEGIRDFFLKKPISFSINYPREDLKSPAIVLLLKNEAEAQTFLGDVMGAPNDNHFPDFEYSYDTDEDGVVPYTGSANSGPLPALTGALRVEEAQARSILIVEDDRVDLAALMERTGISNVVLEVTRGTGAGQTKEVQRLSKERVDIFGRFDVELDSTSVVVLRDATEHPATDGEPDALYDAADRALLRRGAQYQIQYQVLVLGSSQEEVIYLYNVIKAIFFLTRNYLEGQGVHNLQISGTDFAPRSEYLPDIMYQRAMTLSFVCPFYVVTEQEIVRRLELCLFPEDPASYEGSVPIRTTIILEPEE